MGKVRRHIVFHGRVQGVGFRYTARYIACSLGVTGWVRNCWDGSVEMEAQGDADRIDEMVRQLKSQRFIRIRETEMDEVPVLAREYGFNVKY